jgi:hypothetical protein
MRQSSYYRMIDILSGINPKDHMKDLHLKLNID